uniref:translation initiation factor 2 n=1 Tax=Sahlingia subintegra TaxID=468936 RepID=UPI001FCE1527|nr:translation initiation factor 2 [Sahlingia subintegra]UNJ17269.1 translation initiation factor 2 [Sahlingia subintegra]
MSAHNQDQRELEKIIALQTPMIIRQAEKKDNSLIKLTNPLLIKKVDNSLEEDNFQINVGINPRSEKKYKSVAKTEDENVESKKNKLKQKRKNRTKIYLNEEETLNEIKDGYYKLDNNPILSLSIARPPKPNSIIDNKKTLKKIRKNNNNKPNKRNVITKQIQYIDPPSEVQLNNAISIQGLAELTKISHEEIIKFLFLQGTIVNINQIIDLETATLVLNNFDIKINNTPETKKRNRNTTANSTSITDENISLKPRPPIVTIMGHVDHGKTTLLDAIKNSDDKVVENEAGGITQTIGTYEITVNHKSEEKNITFLDTPGHEAFIAMRARGANLADIAILIIAADDGIKPQTEEALKYIQKSGLAMIIAITKIDKEGANIETIKENLTKYDITPEDWGGETPVIPISAISGKNIDQLIENIILLAEIQDLKANYDKPAEGRVIESYIDKAQGAIATILIEEGKLNIGDVVVCGNIFGKVRAMIHPQQQKIKSSGPSSILKISGLSSIADIGEKFSVFQSEKEAKKAIALLKENNSNDFYEHKRNNYVPLEYGINTANKNIQIILKTDTQGSLESLVYSIKSIPQDKIQIEMLSASSGEITENDVNLAASTNSIMIGFNIGSTPGAKNAATKYNLEIQNYNVIYDLIEDLQTKMISMLEPTYLENEIGSGEIKATFNLSKGIIAGCYVTSGKLKKDSLIKVYKGKDEIYKGNLDSIKKVKEDVTEIDAKQECGLFVEGFQHWQSGNIVKSFELIKQKQKL